ncbi:MAG: sulfite exporter TauE/SafE family protein [Cyanobacteria bacterium J06636_16]
MKRLEKLRERLLADQNVGATTEYGFLTVAYLGCKNVGMKRAVGTAAAIGFFIAISGTVGYMISGWSKTLSDPYTLGFIYLPAFLAISIASSVTAPYGARCSQKLPEKFLKKIFAIISLVLSVKMLIAFARF